MTPQTLIAAGEALYGWHWLQPLAAILELNPRTVRRWANGEYNIPDGVWDDLATLCDDRGQTLQSMAQTIRLQMTTKA